MFVIRSCFILVYVVLVDCITLDGLQFDPVPRDVTVFKGENAVLECGVTRRHHITIYWTLNGETIENNTRRYQEDTNLRIRRVDPQHDLGEFKCIAMNVTSGVSLASPPAQLNILWIGDSAKVQLHSPYNLEELNEGDELVLRCKVEGSPEISFEWYHNGIRLFRNERVSFRNKRLHIASLSPQDNGIYSCRAVNKAGAAESEENFPLILPSKNAARIVQLPKDVIVKKGKNVRFDCVYENAAVVEWYVQNKDVPLVNGTRFTIYSNGTLFISNVDDHDEGIYRCVGISALSKDAPQQTYIAHLYIAYIKLDNTNAFEPQVPPGEITIVPRNDMYEVTCIRVDGRPKSKMWWENPSGHVISDSGRIRVDDTRLIISSAKRNDSGNYTCVAENIAGRIKNFINLQVTVPPTITMDPINILVDEGDTVSLNCQYDGNPHPITTIRWLKEDKYVKEVGTHYIVHSNNGSLTIKNIVLSDSASYFCEVYTIGFEPVRSNSAFVDVKEQLKFVPPPVSKNLELGSNAKIYCKARGATVPTVKWIREGRQMFDWPKHIQDENGTLHFNGVKTEDAAKYTCIATNSQGVINTTITVDVIVMPTFSIQPTDTEAYEGYPVILDCKASGDPPPTIQWDKNNALNGFDKKRFRVMENGSLYVSEVHMDDHGKYGCTAGNSGGFRRTEVNLTVKSAEYYNPNLLGKEDQAENTMAKTVAITLGAAAVYMILVLGLMIWCRYRRIRRKAMLLAQATAEVAKSENGDIPADTEMKDRTDASKPREYKDNDVPKSDGEMHSHSSGSHSNQSKRNRSSYDKLNIPRSELQTMMLLGHGEFGEVFLAKTQNASNSEQESIVMVKALQTRDENSHFEFKRELDMFNKLQHENIVKLIGVCKESEPFLAITEYSDWGDLKQFLLATRKDSPRKGPKPPPLSTAQIIGICHQVSLGMEYLSNHRFVHKDIATRNCLVSSRLNVKISSPSLSKDTYAQEYFKYQNKVIPLRWTSAEAALEDEWSTKSDVWSFAVLVWEVLTQANLPFSDKTDESILQSLKQRELTLLPPANTPEPLVEILQKCWFSNPKERPSFSDIAMRIGQTNVDSHV
ncbi:inactive tyrosine-protein kinase 7-like isoform X1 [Centruroides vittatus]|uniref:inactive tyrosine-protein kinase 7-like isoform X1 n=2 Tax=Centruroides vittatus TaxID=120091 RepID=UPI00350EBAFB